MEKRSLISLMILLSLSLLFSQGQIDWERRVITAIGIGSPNPNLPNAAAKRAAAIDMARIMALKELVGTMKGIYISGETTVENYTSGDQKITAQVEGLARAYRMVGGPKYFEDGSVEVTIEMSIDGDLAALVLKGESFSTETGSPYAEEGTASNNSQSGYSGLVIDCSAISLRPALSPKIVDQNGNEIYGSTKVSREFAVQQGMMGYLKDISKAKGNSRVGNNPYIIKAVAVSGANKTDIVLSNEDALKLNEIANNMNFLRECRVVAVVK